MIRRNELRKSDSLIMAGNENQFPMLIEYFPKSISFKFDSDINFFFQKISIPWKILEIFRKLSKKTNSARSFVRSGSKSGRRGRNVVRNDASGNRSTRLEFLKSYFLVESASLAYTNLNLC